MLRFDRKQQNSIKKLSFNTAWLSFIELVKAVVHVIRLASFLQLWFQSVCPLMPSLRAYHLTFSYLGCGVTLHSCSSKAQLRYLKFAGILSAALSQHHLPGFEIAQLEFPSPPLALFVMMLPKAHLTSHSRLSGSR